MQLLIPELCRRGYRVDLLKVRKHGPYLPTKLDNFREIDLKTKHTMTALSAVKRYLTTEQPDVLFADKDRCNRIALWAVLSAKANTRVVVSSGTIMSENLKHRSWLEVLLHKYSINYLYPKAFAIITPSVDAADDLAAISRLNRDSISVVPLPIITDTLERDGAEPVDQPWLANKTAPVLISVGELSPRKDQTTLLQAFAKLRQKRNCKLLILGKGKDRDSLEALARTLNIDNDVAFLGFQKNPHKYIAKADLLVHTANFEGFGMVITEAFGLGTAAVATRCLGGPTEILADGKLGLLSPVADADSLAQAIDSSLARPVSTSDQRKASVSRYTVAASCDAYLSAMGF